MSVRTKSKRERQVPAESDIDSSDLPEGWAVAKLQDVGAWRSGGTPSRTKPEYFGQGIPWVKSGDLPDGPITKTDEQITPLGLENSAAKLMPTGTICMALYGATIGKLGTMTFEAATNQATANLVPDERLVDGKYVFHYLMSERQNFIDMGQGGAQPNISQEIVRKHPIKLAPLDEQRRIVSKLQEVLGKVQQSQQRLARIPALLKRFRQSVLAAACSGKLTADWREENPEEESQSLHDSLASMRENLWRQRASRTGRHRTAYKLPFMPAEDLNELPNTWALVTVSQVAILDQGFAFKSSEFAQRGIRLLRGENLEPGKLRWTDTRYWPENKLDEVEQLLIDEGEIILALDRPVISTGLKIARAAKDDLPCLLVQRMMRFKMVEPKLTPWLFFNLNLPAFIRHLSSGLTGSDLPHVTGLVLRNIPLHFLPSPSNTKSSAVSNNSLPSWIRSKIASRKLKHKSRD